MIVFFRNLNAVHLAKFHDDIEEVHAVQFHLFTERTGVIEIGEILVDDRRRDDCLALDRQV